MNSRIVLVTGGSSGIGRATALAFAQRGATVIVASRGIARGEAVRDELRALGDDNDFLAADVSNVADVERLLRGVRERYGRLDVAVNNAGILDVGVFKDTASFDEAEFDAHIAGNLKSVWACMKYEIPLMLERGAGAIVNVSSVNGLGGVPMNGLYSTAKAGILALTKSAAMEYAPRGVRINALVAGGFRTPMLDGVFARMSPGDPSAAAAAAAQTIPLQRIGNPEEAAEAIVWLASDAASYVVGHSLIVDGGLTAPYR